MLATPRFAAIARSTALTLLLTALGPARADAQFTYGRRPVTQDGRLFDVNPQLGSGGYNALRPASPLFGNAAAFGNVGRGFALQSIQTIQSPTAFRAPLGSSALAAFRRDSTSVADPGLDSGGFLNRPYFDPSESVFTPRYLGFTQAGAPAQDTPYAGAGRFSRPFPAHSALTGPTGRSFGVPESPLDPRIHANYRAPEIGRDEAVSRDALSARIVGLPPDAAAQPGFAAPDRLATSPPVAVPSYPDGAPLFEGGAAPSPAGAMAPTGAQAATPPAVPLPDTRVDPRAREVGSALLVGEPLGQPLDLLLSGGNAGQLLERRASMLGPQPPYGAAAPAMSPAPTPADAPQPAVTPAGAPGSTAPLPLAPPTSPVAAPGDDLFSDIQMAVAYARDPQAAWVADLKSIAAQHPTAALPPDVANADPTAVLQSLLSAPIHSFVGRGESSVNHILSDAETYLHAGDFLKASAEYDKARVVDPANPLPLVGRAHALLAAGDYLTAAASLVQGLERYPELTRLSVDLEAFMGGETIDIRRADITRRLEARDDATLRFLLGYIEYHSGHRDSGLEHLRRAARLAPPGSFIQSFPAILSGQRPLPPPRLPGDIPQRPALRDDRRASRRGAAPVLELDRPRPIVNEDPK